MAFLEILTEFTGKLLKQDKKVVLGYLDKRIAGGVPNSRGEVCVELHLHYLLSHNLYHYHSTNYTW